MWRIVPAEGSHIQPLALPVGSRLDEDIEGPQAIRGYLADQILFGGADKLGFVIVAWKSDILQSYDPTRTFTITYIAQPEPPRLCARIFRALPFVPIPAETAPQAAS